MMVPSVLLITGFALLLKGADWLVEGSSAIAVRAGVSQLIIGLTLVSFGTSLPEFFINLASRLGGQTDITLGDILGSNIANILLILGVSACVRPLTFKKSTLYIEIPFALAAAAALALLFSWNPGEASFRGLSRADGLILLGMFALFILYIFRLQKEGAAGELDGLVLEGTDRGAVLKVAAGIPALVFGARLAVSGASSIAAALGVSKAVIGLTIVAVGTSLPELAASAVAAYKGRSDIVIGNIVGSNIFNICWILGVSAVISPLRVGEAYNSDAAIVILATLLLFLTVFLGKRYRMGRASGAFFLVLYGAYVFSLVSPHFPARDICVGASPGRLP